MTTSLPNVGRPKGNTWRHLQDEGIIWEGQVLITGNDTDLAALLIVTNERLAFVRGGAVALDIAREWLAPAPVLRRTGTVQLWVSPPHDPVAESITFIARDGRDEAAVLLSLIGDHAAYGSAYRIPRYVSEEPPAQPGYPLARSRRPRPEDESRAFALPAALPVFSILDDDDFPPVVPQAGDMPGWEEAIAEALDSNTPIPLANSLRNPNDPIKPIQGFDSKVERDRRSWVVRLVGLFLLAGIGAVIASGILPGRDDMRDALDRDDPTSVSVAQIDSPTLTPAVAPTSTVTSDPAENSSGPSTSDPRDPTVVPLETAVALGVGSDQPSETPIPSPTSTATETPVDTVEQAAQSDDELAPAAVETAVIPPPESESAPTDAPGPDPTETQTEVATEAPAGESVASEPPDEPDASLDSTLKNQAATLGSSEIPAQAFAMGGLRMQISSVYRADTLPDLTLGRNSAGEWIVILIEATNWTDQPANLTMPDFRLAAANDLATEVTLDASTGAVASYLDMNPMMRPDDSTVVPPGGYQPIALVFSVAPGLGDLALLAGSEVVALDHAFDHQREAPLDGTYVPPELVEGTVTDVVNGQMIAIDVNGEASTVLYYGLKPDEPESCYSAEAAEANALLTEGRTVYVERERRNRSESTTYLRDVWVADDSGELQLVAASLVASGAAVPDPSEPDTRFAGWLAGEALVAERSSAGLWSACAGQG